MAKSPLYLTWSFIKMRRIGRVKNQFGEFSNHVEHVGCTCTKEKKMWTLISIVAFSNVNGPKSSLHLTEIWASLALDIHLGNWVWPQNSQCSQKSADGLTGSHILHLYVSIYIICMSMVHHRKLSVEEDVDGNSNIQSKEVQHT